jgi:hypothetical protein
MYFQRNLQLSCDSLHVMLLSWRGAGTDRRGYGASAGAEFLRHSDARLFPGWISG